MAKGQMAKAELVQELLDFFGDRAFVYDKDIRVNCEENGELCQIKLTLTAAKVPVTKDGDTALPGESTVAINTQPAVAQNAVSTDTVAAPTAEEKQNIAELMAKLGL